ncbi:Glycerol-3-phosphate O-acyltransferase, alpha helical bundle, N-terminal [Artemisia annua]|uniref:Glycerol-3-phosphate acyltransferase, chloroplastic n=1 Tax=Artemisia annua TaxID=35608 RepID=A0A2U1LG68_ARTAN|nr:Glycerol-3-phosphate O-acyltransferase, alpha helical bundle, N-terminal [Artemisia annua]
MSILSPSLFFSTTTPRLRVSLSPTSTSTSSSSTALLRCRRRFPCFAVSGAAAESVRDAAEKLGYERSAFIDARSEKDLLSGIQRELEAGTLPRPIAQSMEELYQNYKNAVLSSGVPHAEDIVLANMRIAFDRMFSDVKEPFEFSPYHEAIKEPFNYYLFGQNYIRPLINFRESYVGNVSIFSAMEEQLKQGENVIFISNHQSEADPAVIALLLETTNPYISENIIYVAGDRVITDPLCKPFSMGRNLLCVYSKKHMNDVPELADMKRRANTRSLKEMALLLRGGSKIIWIAPSGGRDRPDPITNQWFPAPFDATSLDNMRRLVDHAGVVGHIYPLAILCHDIMPPPPQVEKDIGEKRLIGYHGTGISVAPEINFQEATATCGSAEEAKIAYSQAMYDSVCEQYNVLQSAINEAKGLEASTPNVSLSQPLQLLD